MLVFESDAWTLRRKDVTRLEIQQVKFIRRSSHSSCKRRRMRRKIIKKRKRHRIRKRERRKKSNRTRRRRCRIKLKTKLHGFDPRANYADRATAASWRS
jgi:hypothetical protein